MPTPLQVHSRERIHIRTRESGVTLAAWRIQLDQGSIVLVDIAGRACYRGEGGLLAASQETLAALWTAALPPDEPPQDNLLLG